MRNRLGIKKLILLMGLLPTLGMSVALGSLLVYNQLRDVKTALLDRSQLSSQQLAVLAGQFLNPTRQAALSDLATAALEEAGLRSITILDSQGATLVQAGPIAAPPDKEALPLHTAQIIHHASELQIITPIPHRQISADAPAGWISSHYSWHQYEVRKYQTLLAAVVFLVMALLLSIAMVSYITKALRNDFDQLKLIIRRQIDGNKDFQAHIPGNDDFSELARQLNLLNEAHQHELRELRRGIEQSNSDLRETLETVEVQNIELDLARREAMNASRIKSEFLANTSHEIRTPLNGILGFTKILLKSELEQQQYDAVETIRKSADSLLTIINDILDFSKMEAGKLVFDQAPVDVRELIEDTLTILAPSAYDKNLELALFVDPAMPAMLVSDSLRLKQILTNLLNNAIKFTPAGHVLVNVIFNERHGQDVSFTVQVSDTGIGLSKDQQRALFKGFSQADASITRQYGGTGLGLVIVKGLVDQMGGEIGVESEMAKGSTFWFTLRLPEVKNAIRMRNFAAMQGKSVAYYDRSALHADAISQMLKQWGMDVKHSSTLDGLADECDFILLSLTTSEQLPSETVLPSAAHPPIVLVPDIDAAPESLKFRSLQKPVSQVRLFDAFNNRAPRASNNVERFPNMRVLAVDDNPANLLILKSFLNDHDVAAQSAQNGVEAIQLCRENVFDLILMDIQMPHIDGIQASKEIHSDSLNKNTPIVALSAYLAPENPMQLREAGIAEFLSKPIDESQLLSLLRKTAFGPDQIISKPVDITSCLKLAKGRPALAEEMLQMLLNSLPAHKQALTAALEARDVKRLAAIQHDIKGACCYTGTPLLKAANLDLGVALDNSGEQSDLHAQVELVLAAMDELLQWQECHELPVLFAD
ncbi:ATP-binding protein [Spongiibacter taiwanensis]|uniref:ATP-binding protein n=1 Tax=Spongiibacter taiwanensis TaxID=1748242 RepID=UPI002034EB89|nr:ATP-binding protein [Spongiibacter taiwanensis]USA43662.1 ATP-binding protein [Spongiibacter taiwanensis]